MVKLIIWDLDDTLWRGTLADADTVEPCLSRCDMVRAFNARGVVSSICSKNDPELAKNQLVKMELWEEFVFPYIAFEPKSHGVASIIANMQLRPHDVLFIDDNAVNLEEVRYHIPEINLLDIKQTGADAWLYDLLAQQQGTARRADQYKIIEQKKADRAVSIEISDEDFLRSCNIEVMSTFLMENLDFVERIAELINRSNQLNYTKSRTTIDELRTSIIDVLTNVSLAVFARDKYGDHGLVGFVMLERPAETYRVVHFVFSCRVMHMGLEQYAMDHIARRADGYCPPIHSDVFDELNGRFIRVDPDWISTISYSDPDNRAKAIRHDAGLSVVNPAIRIMYNCQSAGLAHYSQLRSCIDYDSIPRVFSLRSFCEPEKDRQFLKHVVYGAGIDYANGPWTGLENVLDIGLYELCAHRMCEFVEQLEIQLLVVLPPEHLRPEQYHPWMGHTLERTTKFNNVWRSAFHRYRGISLIDIAKLHGPEDMRDVNHHYPSSLRKLSHLIDTWYEQVSSDVDAERIVA